MNLRKQLKRPTWVLPLVVSILTTGCAMVGPDFKTPDAPLVDEWSAEETPVISNQLPADTQWWKVFNDPVLDQLIQTAYEQNLSLQIAGLRVLEARAQLGIVTGSLYP